MGKHKRKHADLEEPGEDTPNMDMDPDTQSKKVKKHKKSHKRERDYSSDISEGHRTVLPSRSKKRKQSAHVATDEHTDSGSQNNQLSLIPHTPKKSKKILNGDYDQRSNSEMMDHKRRQSFEPAPDDPAITKILENMKRGLTDAKVGDPDILAAEELEGDDDDVEIFLIQCPENVNPVQLLENQKIKFGNDSVTSLGDNYESVFLTDENEKTVTIVLPDKYKKSKVVSAKLAGQIVIREAIDEMEAPAPKIEDKIAHTLPADLKERHPVFGTDFSIPLKYDPVEPKKKSKKSRKSKKEDYEDYPTPVPVPMKPTAVPVKEKHKPNGFIQKIDIDAIEIESDNDGRHKKKKSKRSKSEGPYQVELLPDAESSRKSQKKKKDKKSRQEAC